MANNKLEILGARLVNALRNNIVMESYTVSNDISIPVRLLLPYLLDFIIV